MVVYRGTPPLSIPEEGAQLTVKLFDLTQADRDPQLLARTVRTVRNTPPYPYRVAYTAESIDGGGSYAVEGEIEVEGTVRYRSRGRVPVLTNGAPHENVEIVLEAVAP
jgi:uncharacterized lipoprotein YbaY